jgi:RHS repeat-associated protein
LLTVTAPDPDGGGSLPASVTTYEYDAHDNRIKTIAHDTGETLMAYDDVGNLLSLTDPEGNETLWVYDKLDRAVLETNELGHSRYFEYDKAGNLVEKTDRNGRVVEYVHDRRHRLTTERWKDGANTVRELSFTYSPADRLMEASDPAATYTFAIDGRGQITDETHDIAGLTPEINIYRQRDAEGRLTEMQTWIGSAADLENTYTYDFLSRVTGITQEGTSGGNAVATKRVDFAYNKLHQFTQIDRYADVAGFEYVASSHYAYDGMNRLARLTHNDSLTPGSGWGNNPLAGYQYAYDAASRITSIDSYLDGLSTFTYDTTHQLTAADHTGQTDETYDYDLNGNRDTTGYSVGTNNRMLSDGTFNYTYDNEGNRLTKTNISTSEKEEYTWDHRNRLTKITFMNSVGTIVKTVDKTYDAFNRWIKRTVDPDGATSSAPLQDTYFAYVGNQILFDFDGSSASDLAHRYTWGPSVDQFMASEEVTSLSSAGEVLWGLGDHLGTLRDIAEFDGSTLTTSVVNHRRYEAFGERVSETNAAVDLLFGYTGRALDESTGQQYNSARWYTPETGNWMSEDPIHIIAGDPNFGRYAHNDPMSFTDPTGLEPPPRRNQTIPPRRDIPHQGPWWEKPPEEMTFREYVGAMFLSLKEPIARPIPRDQEHMPSLIFPPHYARERFEAGDPNYTTTRGEFYGECAITYVELSLVFVPTGSVQKGLRYLPGERHLLREGLDSGARYIWDPDIAKYRAVMTGSPIDAKRIPWPLVKNGFKHSSQSTLEVGMIVDRYGRPTGRFAGVPGTSITERGMAIGTEYMEYHRYKVLKELECQAGPAAAVPAFGAKGGGMQYYFDKSIAELIKLGYLKEVP